MTARGIALVTGGNRGLGLEICRQMAQKGFILLLGARDEAGGRAAASQLVSSGLDVRFILLDMEKPGTFDSAYRYIEKEFGWLDVLVNNAGIAIDGEYRADSIPMEVVRKTFDTNFFGLIDLTHRLLPLILRSPAGRIVNQSSILGSLTLQSTPGSGLEEFKPFAYSASKAALNAFTIHLADALKNTPVKVNSAHPGNVKSEMNPSGHLSLSEGAQTTVSLALLPGDGPSGGFFHFGRRLPR